MIWCCPHCQGDLAVSLQSLRCSTCHRDFETVAGIPDLRIEGDSWIDFEEDLVAARELATSDRSVEDLIRSIYSRRGEMGASWIDRRTREILGAPARLRSDVHGWLRNFCAADGSLLDIGCAAGMLLAAMANAGKNGIGIDVSMTWLVVANRLIKEHGGTPVIAAAMAENLPLRDNSVSGAVSLDVIEHVLDPDRFLVEINRVVGSEGKLALSTPNRFSLTAEPHVFVWGVGWLPKRLQARYVKWRSGKEYRDTTLMSSFGLSRLIRRCTDFRFRIVIPRVPEENIAGFSRTKATLARLYNKIASFHLLRIPFLIFAPFFRVVGEQTRAPDISRA